MKKLALCAAILLAPAALSAQTQQEQLDDRYDRALAAGYKSLFLCSAIANAEANGTTRSIESILEWELKGIQQPLASIIHDLSFELNRNADGQLREVRVDWDGRMAPRSATYSLGQGCTLAPIAWREKSYASIEVWDVYPADRSAVAEFHARDRSRPEKLDDPVHNAFAKTYGGGTRTSSVVVQSAGEIVAEDYAEGFDSRTPQRTWSVAKSLAATLVGYYINGHGEGIDVLRKSAGLGVDDDDPRRAITLDHLLRMSSGRYSDTPGNRTDPIYWGGSTVGDNAGSWPIIDQPGEKYRYANNDTMMAFKAIKPLYEGHPPSLFFGRIGMQHTVAEQDWNGNYILSSQAWTTARDLIKLGQLYLDDGILPSGERVLPEGWTDYVASPSGPQPEGRPFGYGAGFWLLNNSEGVPTDTIAALGNRGQHLVIVPSRNVVIVRRGEDPVGSRFDIAGFTRDVLAALDE